MITKNITNKFLSSIWLTENVLGRYSDKIIIDQEKETIKRILCDVYGYKDIYDFIPQRVSQENLNRFLKTVFTYHERPEEQIEINK